MYRMNKEIWKDVKGYEGLYKVSNLGNVYGCKRGKLLRLSLNNRGYLHVSLSKGKVRETTKVHKLVAINFLNHAPCGLKELVDHINNNKLDNRACNLQLLSARMNSLKPIRGKSKYRGVSYVKKVGKWRASIYINGKSVYLGEYINELDASKAYEAKLKEQLLNQQS